MKSSVFRLCSYFDSATSYFIGSYGLNDKVRATFKEDVLSRDTYGFVTVRRESGM